MIDDDGPTRLEWQYLKAKMIDSMFDGEPKDVHIGEYLYHITGTGQITAEVVGLPSEEDDDFDPPMLK